ncbi:MAG: hypothetical protein DCC67_16940 [Planctomycetota bacterium]|nr:MAG: hypothetical protein DCC67_16940 [Planctomycetota bacterium]
MMRCAAACGLLIAVAAALPHAAAQSGGEMKPLATVTLSSYDQLMKDIDFIGSLAGQAQASQGLDQMLTMMTQQKGLAGLDKSKPLGLLVQTDGQMPAGALCVPVTDLDALLDVAKGFGVTSQDAGDGLTQLSTPQGQSVFAKTSNGWALLSISPDMLGSLPADPGVALAPLAKDYDLGLRLHMQNLPEAYRQMAIQAMSEGAKQGLTQKDDESEEQFKARQDQVNAQLAEMERFFNEVDEITIGLSIDAENEKALLDFAYTAQPGTKLAEDIAANSKVTTDFAGFVQPDAAATLSFASKMTGADAAQLDAMVESLRTQMTAAIDDEEQIKSDEAKEQIKAAANDFIDALKATLEAGVMDGGASLRVTPESLTFVAGGFIADPAKVESGLKKIAEAAKQEDAKGEVPEIKWNASKHKDVAFHTLQAPVEEDDEEARQLFGETVDMVVGIGEKAVYFAAGRNAVDAVKQAIDASAAAPDKPIPPMELTVAISQFINAAKAFADEDDKPQLERISEMLANEASEKDHVRLSGEAIDNGIRMRIEAEEGVLRAIGMAAMQAQMQAAGF